MKKLVDAGLRMEVVALMVSYLAMLTVILVLPFFSHPGYSMLRNTTSHLAAQHMPHAWIMNVTFVALGVTSIWAGWSFYQGFPFHKVVLTAFGLSLVGAAIFRHASIDPSLPVNALHDRWHSLFATFTGISFTLLAIGTAFIVGSPASRSVAVLMAVVATALSAAMFRWPDYMGVFQRAMFISCFGWLLLRFTQSARAN